VRVGRGFERGVRSVRKSRQKRLRELGAWRKADPHLQNLNACMSLMQV
jgi:hypothetical protein